MQVITKPVASLTPDEYRACRLANFGYDGYMMEELQRRRREKSLDAIAIMLWDGPSDKASSLKGWTLLTPVSQKGMLSASRYICSKAKYTAQFWVKKQHRRQGLGTILMLEVKKHDERPHVIPHDIKSVELFSKFKVRSSNYDRPLKRSKPKVA